MKTLYVPIGLAWVCCFLAGQVSRETRASSPVAATSAEITFGPAPLQGGAVGTTPVEPGDYREERLDLRGNAIEDAVEDYRIDRGGGLYERHSPETMISRLAAPSS